MGTAREPAPHISFSLTRDSSSLFSAPGAAGIPTGPGSPGILGPFARGPTFLPARPAVPLDRRRPPGMLPAPGDREGRSMKNVLAALVVVGLTLACVTVLGLLYWQHTKLADAQFQHLLADWRDAVP